MTMKSENPEPIEQAAPPRPLDVPCKYCHAPLKMHYGEHCGLSSGQKFEPEGSEVRPPESEVILKFIAQERHLPDCPADECNGKCARIIAQEYFSAPAAIEQAAALRKEPELVIDMEKALADSLAMLPKSRCNPEREPQRSEVKPNEAQSQKSAAIEQARPQPPRGFTPQRRWDDWKNLPSHMLSHDNGSGECSASCRACMKAKQEALKELAAAAEPAPERTHPAEFARLYWRDIHLGVCDHTGYCKCAEGHMEDLLTKREAARAVAVPEPAAQHGKAVEKMLKAIHCLRLEVNGSIVDEIHNKFMAALIESVEAYRRARQAEPAPTPSREWPSFAEWIETKKAATEDVFETEAEVQAAKETLDEVLAESDTYLFRGYSMKELAIIISEHESKSCAAPERGDSK